MTTLRSAGPRGSAAVSHPAPAPTIPDLVCRLREAAARLVAFSETKLLLREAASTIERLHREQGAGEDPAGHSRPATRA